MKIRSILTGVASLTIFIMAVAAQAADVSNAKCPVSGQPVKEDKTVEFEGGTVYFCCEKCPGGFEKNKAKFTAKAHHQMVVTGQAKQEKCPFSGQPTKAEQTSDVDGVSVSFCCEKCKAKVDKAEGDKKTAMVFGAAPFKKGFKVAK